MTALRLDIGGIDDAIALNSEGSAVSNEGTGIRAREFFAAHVERYGLPFGNGDEPPIIQFQQVFTLSAEDS